MLNFSDIILSKEPQNTGLQDQECYYYAYRRLNNALEIWRVVSNFSVDEIQENNDKIGRPLDHPLHPKLVQVRGSAARDPHGIKQITVGPPHGIKQITMFIRENVECLDSSFTTTTTIKLFMNHHQEESTLKGRTLKNSLQLNSRISNATNRLTRCLYTAEVILCIVSHSYLEVETIHIEMK
ncbi:hypothetical protein J6590_044601 [Homalodisca vitripennis]|nr:hypothetical protein J6590_044601 [Homalodisca vitripennis]